MLQYILYLKLLYVFRDCDIQPRIADFNRSLLKEEGDKGQPSL